MTKTEIWQASLALGIVVVALGLVASGYRAGSRHKNERYHAALCSTHGGTQVAEECIDSSAIKHTGTATRTFDCPSTGACLERKTEGR